MSLYPEVQKAAQAEADRIVGPERSPTFRDRHDMPYIHAIMKESLRWHAILPGAVPHQNISDDELDGYFIPQGTTIWPNIWCAYFSVSKLWQAVIPKHRLQLRAMQYNPEVYPRPEEFMPERFMKDGKLNPDVRDPGRIAFGFGRRYV